VNGRPMSERPDSAIVTSRGGSLRSEYDVAYTSGYLLTLREPGLIEANVVPSRIAEVINDHVESPQLQHHSASFRLLGQGLVPYEQKTQQSPGFGRRT
jgi:hypothetical protein